MHEVQTQHYSYAMSTRTVLDNTSARSGIRTRVIASKGRDDGPGYTIRAASLAAGVLPMKIPQPIPQSLPLLEQALSTSSRPVL